ncbi:MAG: hypothetical protein FD157_3378 [Rhodocyclaceae bacterium]|nr:MAG: hypothetical protein FD157_3378 [Rhodocyclaceae bacterium]TNC99406.1 MAG: hypothetical protein FD118_3776 [Rhodocyclaceae bacterium]
MSTENATPKTDSAESLSTAGLGAAIFVNGRVVAWFADFTDEARDWCTENHFGQWLAWRAKSPELVPLTEAEYDAAMLVAKELATLFNDIPQAPNVRRNRRDAASSRRVRVDGGVGGLQ